MKIVRYVNTANMTIEFLDLYKYQTDTTYQNFTNNNIKNPYDRSVCGVGYLGVGKHMAKINNKLTTPYVTWRDMIYRCYDEKNRHKHLTYSNSYVCDKWHNYQQFASWYEDNIYQVDIERMHIDKDILYKNNTIYSPETCLIVPQRINMIFMQKTRKDNLPTGITLTESKRYGAMYNTQSLGAYDTLKEAMYQYNKAKQLHIRNVAEEYKNKIPTTLYDALYDWIPDNSVRVA